MEFAVQANPLPQTSEDLNLDFLYSFWRPVGLFYLFVYEEFSVYEYSFWVRNIQISGSGVKK